MRIKKVLKYIYHKSNPAYRNNIKKKGLIIGKGAGYLGIDDKIGIKAISATNSDSIIDWYNTTYDDDIWQINTTKIDNIWYKDTNVFGKHKHIYTTKNIPKSALKLVYKGTGESLI